MKIAQRANGVLLHVTSLPSDFGIGDLGPWSYRFVDLLAQANQRYWSILPLTPTSTKYGNSPYQATSAFAGNTLLISPELLFKDMLLSEKDIKRLRLPFGRVDFKAVTAKKKIMLKKAYRNFIQNGKSAIKAHDYDFEKFCLENSSWLDDYALYEAIQDFVNKPWYMWSISMRDKDASVLAQKRVELKEFIEQEKVAQFIFVRQWTFLRQYCQAKEVSVLGDLPFYMSYDSADVWTHPELFKLDSQKRPRYVGGVPPDYFSKTGQRWGNPVYDWREIKKTHFQWWVDRMRRNLELCDIMRLDHFRGFTAYWQIPASSKTAKEGVWIRVPSKSFFGNLRGFFPSMPLIAEDLGLITNNVKDNLKRLGIPGMRVLLFAFNGSEDNPNLPANHTKNSVAYTGTHDTNTVKGWFDEEATPEETKRVFKCVGRQVSKRQINLEFIKLVMASKSNLSIIPVQDVLDLGSEARMNHPARRFHNWEWRVKSEQLSSKSFEKLSEMTESSGRSSS